MKETLEEEYAAENLICSPCYTFGFTQPSYAELLKILNQFGEFNEQQSEFAFEGKTFLTGTTILLDR